jgi:hypothetical protein
MATDLKRANYIILVQIKGVCGKNRRKLTDHSDGVGGNTGQLRTNQRLMLAQICDGFPTNSGANKRFFGIIG